MRIPTLQAIAEARARWRWPPETIVFSLVLIFLAAGCLARDLNHDEHQFVASGALLARAGLLPYLDYPYFHLPNLVFVFAALFKTNDFLLLTARSFNVLCAWLLLGLFFSLMLAAFRSFGEKRWPIATAITLMLSLNPVFRVAAGRAWNHDLPILASIGAFATLLRAAQPRASARWMAASGALLGVALGTRLTFLPLIVPFLILTLIFGFKTGAGYRGAFFFLGAMSIALLPTIALLTADPKAFFFDNFAANGVLNLRFRWAIMPERASYVDKVFFLAGLLLTSPSNLLLLTGFVVFACWLPWRGGWRMAFSSPESVAILLIVPFTLLGAILPTPSYRQYYSMVVPFLFLGTAFGLARFWNTAAAEGKLSRLLFWSLIASFLEAIPDLYGSGVAARPDRWAIWSIHRAGLEIQRQAGPGPILTLAPIYPLEGRSPIYQQLCTGPFAWRLSSFATEKDRSHYQFIGPDNFESHLTIKPGAILTHVDEADSDSEAPLIRYARDNAFAMIQLADGSVLWVPQRE